MSRAKVKKLKVKRNTSIKSLHEAFPDMKSWALRASAGHICYSVYVSAEGFEWQKNGSCKDSSMWWQASGIARPLRRCSNTWGSMGGQNSSQCERGNDAIDVVARACHHLPGRRPHPHTHIYTHIPLFFGHRLTSAAKSSTHTHAISTASTRYACLYFDRALKDLSPDWILSHRMQLRKLAKDMHAEKGFYVHPAVVVSKLKKARS